ncbi:unnamed protein product [Ceratitis capitata]|uniref:(Mediterranean fruit fly) hypothetical protein n=1 Tax=Ceratitis capitata TaxID=7213 RepID=A0A811U854_CERCA|nr:unnamed protein product [Ceratitis capitata]
MSLCDTNIVTMHPTPQQQHQSTQSIADYLAQLLKDRKQMAAFPNVFNHVERLLDEDIPSEAVEVDICLIKIAVSCTLGVQCIYDNSMPSRVAWYGVKCQYRRENGATLS